MSNGRIVTLIAAVLALLAVLYVIVDTLASGAGRGASAVQVTQVQTEGIFAIVACTALVYLIGKIAGE